MHPLKMASIIFILSFSKMAYTQVYPYNVVISDCVNVDATELNCNFHVNSHTSALPSGDPTYPAPAPPTASLKGACFNIGSWDKNSQICVPPPGAFNGNSVHLQYNNEICGNDATEEDNLCVERMMNFDGRLNVLKKILETSRTTKVCVDLIDAPDASFCWNEASIVFPPTPGEVICSTNGQIIYNYGEISPRDNDIKLTKTLSIDCNDTASLNLSMKNDGIDIFDKDNEKSGNFSIDYDGKLIDSKGIVIQAEEGVTTLQLNGSLKSINGKTFPAGYLLGSGILVISWD